MTAAKLIELWRGGIRESTHLGHVVIADGNGIIEAWGDPGAVIFPRSSCKMIQALPLVESGAADAAGLGPEHLALACASLAKESLRWSLLPQVMALAPTFSNCCHVDE